MSKFKTIVIYILSVLLAFGIGVIIPIMSVLSMLANVYERPKTRVSYRNYYNREESD